MTPSDDVAPRPSTRTAARQRELGARLRSVRVQQELSLAQVEERSEGRWKAVVVGAYERGDRAVTIERLAELARFYGVPLTHLLPTTPGGPQVEQTAGGVALDLTRLRPEVDRADAIGAVARFADRICLLRGDHGGRVVTLRDADLRTLAMAAGLAPDDLRARLDDDGLVAATS